MLGTIWHSWNICVTDSHLCLSFALRSLCVIFAPYNSLQRGKKARRTRTRLIWSGREIIFAASLYSFSKPHDTHPAAHPETGGRVGKHGEEEEEERHQNNINLTAVRQRFTVCVFLSPPCFMWEIVSHYQPSSSFMICQTVVSPSLMKRITITCTILARSEGNRVTK